MLLTVTIFKFLSLAYKIVFEQSALDIFVIDWESPRMYKYKNNYPKMAINPWRRLFIVNEFNELQTSKVVVTEMMLILFLVIAEGFGFKNFSQMEANISRDQSMSPQSFSLNFFVITCIIFFIGCLQYTLTSVLSPMFPPDYVEFIDLCSVANISLIMFNEDLNGYYIHGKSASGAADVSSERLRLNLEAEKQGNATIRGIHSSLPDGQTFEIFLPNKMIDDYKKNFLIPVRTEIETTIQKK